MFPISRNWRFIIQASCILILIFSAAIWFKPGVIPSKYGKYDEIRFNFFQQKSQQKYLDTCFEPKLVLDIGHFETNLHTWSQAIDRHCQILWGKFQDMYTVSIRRGILHFPHEFQRKISMWLGNDNNLVKRMYNQSIYHVRNVYTFEHTIYNPLRSLRPSSTSRVHPRIYVQNLVQETNKSCDFCNYEEMTAEDVSGRVKGKYSVSAANTFKLDKWHALFLTRKHNPLDLNEEDILDIFNTSLKWFKRVHHTMDSSARYPMIIWDNLPHAGASQLHPHLHGMLDPMQYYGVLNIQYEAAKKYFFHTGNAYWEDFIEIHRVLGLAVSFKSAVAIAPLTSKKDHEIFIVSNSPNAAVFQLLFYVIKTYYDKLNIYCFSCGMALPDMKNIGSEYPVIIRIGTRGDCSSIQSDTSSLELYSVNNVNVDPYTTISHLRKTIHDFMKKDVSDLTLVAWP